MRDTGIFISFEGIDGAGKSSHIDALAQLFRQRGRVVTVTREPGGTPLAEKLRALVLNEPMDGLTEALLVFAARRSHVHGCIEPALQRGEVVLSDRFTDSTFAYQGGGQGLDWSVLEELERLALAFSPDAPVQPLQPDLTLWFDLDPAEAAARLEQARVPDRFESRDRSFFERVRRAYLARAEAAPHRVCRIDAGAARATVWAQVEQLVRGRGWMQ